MEIKTVKDFINALRSLKYTSYGCYPKFFYTEDGQALSFDSAHENVFLIARAIRDNNDKQWRVIGMEINWENNDLYCSHSGEKIESAY